MIQKTGILIGSIVMNDWNLTLPAPDRLTQNLW